MSPDDARRRARRDFGDPLRWKEQAFEVRGAGWVTDLGADVRYGLRQMRRAPVFTATVLVTLAAGIGLNTAVFSVIDAVLVRSLSYPDPERVLWVTTVDRDQEFVAALDYLAWKEQATSFDGLVAFETSDYAIYTADNVVQSRITSVSEDFWTVADGRPMQGRLPQRGEDAILLSHAFFVGAFGADPAVVGRAVSISGRQVTIAGVLAPGFRAQMTRPDWAGRPEAAIDAYRTLTVRSPTNGQMRLISVIGKLKAGVSVERAQSELEAIRGRTRTANPNFRLPPTLRMTPLKEKIVGDATRPLIVLLSAAGFVFLIACANVANLFLARASARRTEVAIRAAIGAGRWRLARQFFVESALIAAAGAIAGLVVARWSLATIVRVFPHAVPRLQETTIDGRALAFAAATAIVAALVFGMVPVWSLWKDDARGVLKQALSKQAMSGALPIAGKLRTKTALVALEFALTIVLLIGAGLLIKSLWRLNALPEGFHPDRIVTMQIQFSGPAYREDGARHAHAAEALRRVSAVPGVRAAAVTTNADSKTRLFREGDPFPARRDDQPAFALVTIASADLAQVMGIRLVRGRWLTDFEPSQAWVINETLARRHFGDSDPVGARFRVPYIGQESWATVVGVVADSRLQRLDSPAEPELYIDWAHGPLFGYSIVASVITDGVSAAAEIRRSVAGVDAAVPVLEVKTLEVALADSIAPYRFNLFTFGLFAVVALLLASVGIYGTLAYSMSRRTQEIGIRLALGAARGEVLAMVIRQGMTVALIGTFVGLVIGVAVARVMKSLLYEVSPIDPYIFAAAAVVLLLAGFAASLGPALRAASVQPLIALRHE